jgi:cytochrome P450
MTESVLQDELAPARAKLKSTTNPAASNGTASQTLPVKDPKLVRGYPIVGGLVDIFRDGPGFVTRIAQAHRGEIVGLRLGPTIVYLVTNPEHVQQVVQDWRVFGKGGGMFSATRRLLGHGLLTSDGEFWRQQRRMMQPLFQPGNLAALTELMVEVIDRETTLLSARSSATVDMEVEMNAMSQRVILETMLGRGIDRSETDRLNEHLQVALDGLNLRMFLYFLPEMVPLPGERRYRAAIAAIDEAMLRLVRQRRAHGAVRDDLMSLLLRARDEETGRGMDDRQVRDELVSIFVAGQDATAKAMTWLWYLLDRHPEIEQRVRDEAAQVLDGRRPAFADLANLKYTKRVIQEAMRLYPPAWMIPHFVEAEAIVGGYRIPAHSPILLSPFATHRDPALWPDPETFDPERFTPERSAGRPRYAYYPFGGGGHQCIGNHFAMMETQLITVMMLQRLRATLVPGHRVVPSSSMTLKARYGMKMTLNATEANGESPLPFP